METSQPQRSTAPLRLSGGPAPSRTSVPVQANPAARTPVGPGFSPADSRVVADSVSLSAKARARIAGSLVAAQIPRADPVSAPPSSTPPTSVAREGGPLPMYRHPADKNAAATAVTAGRRLDVTG